MKPPPRIECETKDFGNARVCAVHWVGRHFFLCKSYGAMGLRPYPLPDRVVWERFWRHLGAM